uniref:Uncharacterized protein n=1 Tax=Ditylenchus dipsaci TaxID=166011 RepID=A0A915E524_9BILA
MWTPIIFVPLLLSSAFGQPAVLISPEERFKESSHFSRLHDSASSPVLGDSTEAAPFEEFEFELLDNGEEDKEMSDVGERVIEDVDTEESEDESTTAVQSPSSIGSAKLESQSEDRNGSVTIKSKIAEDVQSSNPSLPNPPLSNVSDSSELTTPIAVASTLPLPQDDNPTFNPISSEPVPVLCASVNEHPTFIRHTNPPSCRPQMEALPTPILPGKWTPCQSVPTLVAKMWSLLMDNLSNAMVSPMQAGISITRVNFTMKKLW